jgi:hypothetical protein
MNWQAYKKAEEGKLLSMVDPNIAQYETDALEWFMELALSCCREMQEDRPTMGEVVSDLEQLGRSHVNAFSMEISKPLSPGLPAKPRRGISPNKSQCESPVSDGGGIWSDPMMRVSPR